MTTCSTASLSQLEAPMQLAVCSPERVTPNVGWLEQLRLLGVEGGWCQGASIRCRRRPTLTPHCEQLCWLHVSEQLAVAACQGASIRGSRPTSTHIGGVWVWAAQGDSGRAQAGRDVHVHVHPCLDELKVDTASMLFVLHRSLSRSTCID